MTALYMAKFLQMLSRLLISWPWNWRKKPGLSRSAQCHHRSSQEQRIFSSWWEREVGEWYWYWYEWYWTCWCWFEDGMKGATWEAEEKEWNFASNRWVQRGPWASDGTTAGRHLDFSLVRPKTEDPANPSWVWTPTHKLVKINVCCLEWSRLWQ